jgi:hypothetical protein
MVCTGFPWGVDHRAALRDQLLGPDHGRGRVGRVPVRAHDVGVLLGDRGAADHDDDLIPQARLLQRVDVRLEHRHRRGQERGEADDVRLVLTHRIDELLGRDLHAEVDDVEAGALEHDVDQVLADVVHVALDGAHHDGPDRLGAGLGEQRAQDLQRPGHCLAGDEHLGHEEVAALEPGTHLFQRRDQRLVQQRLRPQPHGQPLVGEVEHRGPVADQRLVVELAEQLLGRHAAPAFRFCLAARCR